MTLTINLTPDTEIWLRSEAERQGLNTEAYVQQILERSRRRSRTLKSRDEVTSRELAALATSGGAFDWLEGEPDLYDDTCGEPI